jgi:hypothetical protein
MSSPDDNERSDDFPNSDYAPKWTRDSYRQGSPDTAKGEPPPSFLRRSLDREIVHLPQRARSLDPETVDLPQAGPRRLGWFTAERTRDVESAVRRGRIAVKIAKLPDLLRED